MERKYKIGQRIKITGNKASNPEEDIGKQAIITDVQINRDDISKNPEESRNRIHYEIVQEPMKYEGHFAYECDVKPLIENKDNIIARKLAAGGKEELIEMGLVDNNGEITQKGYNFIEKFE